jgi:hypothetical protein
MKRRSNVPKSIVSNVLKYKSSKSRKKILDEVKNKSLTELSLTSDKSSVHSNDSSEKKDKSLSAEKKKKKKENVSLKSIKDSINLDKEETIKVNNKRSTTIPKKKFDINDEKKEKNSDKNELSPKEIVFNHSDKKNLINQFRPNLTPRQIFLLGSFGGTYWRPIYSGVLKKNLKDQHLKYHDVKNTFTGEMEDWWKGIDDNLLTRSIPDLKINKYRVHSGTSLEDWESKNWISAQDPYGWVQWYCEFYSGRRSDDDHRQIRRWLNFAGPKGRFKLRIVNMIKNKNTTFDDFNISPIIRQGLQHWGYQLTPEDVSNEDD